MSLTGKYGGRAYPPATRARLPRQRRGAKPNTRTHTPCVAVPQRGLMRTRVCVTACHNPHTPHTHAHSHTDTPRVTVLSTSTHRRVCCWPNTVGVSEGRPPVWPTKLVCRFRGQRMGAATNLDVLLLYCRCPKQAQWGVRTVGRGGVGGWCAATANTLVLTPSLSLSCAMWS